MIVYICDRCGKKLSEEERKNACMQVRFRNSHSALEWESKWNNLCGKCYGEFENWYYGGKNNEHGIQDK